MGPELKSINTRRLLRLAMEMNEYQEKALSTALYPTIGKPFIYPVLGLVGEAGEVAEKLKKVMRNDGGNMSDEKNREIAKELGDVLWYLAVLAKELGLSLDEVARMNVEKLADRKARNVIKSEGDNR